MTYAPSMKLGKLPPRNDPRTLKATNYIDPGALPTGDTNLSKKAAWPVYANDRYGDCGPAACAHQIGAWTGADGSKGLLFDDQDVLAFYSSISGFNPRTGANDVGVNMLDMLNHWRKVGLGGHRILAYMQIDTHDRDMLKACNYLFGGVQYGFALPTYIQGRDRWTLADQKGRRWDQIEPNGWGGHAVYGSRHTARRKDVITWGRVMPTTWEFIREYSDERYAVVSEDWTGPDGKAPNGFALDSLLHDLARV